MKPHSIHLAIEVLANAPVKLRNQAIGALLQRSALPSSFKEQRRSAVGDRVGTRVGSVRRDVHRILGQYGEISRVDLIDAVARLRGVNNGDIEPLVDAALRYDRGRLVQRIARGRYRLIGENLSL